MSLLRLEGIGKRHSAAFALAAVDLAVGAGSRLAVLGPSGSGKTTLLRLVAGFDRPDAGRIVLDGAVVADGPAARPAHERGIGYVAQDGALFPHLTVAGNVGFGLPRAEPDRRGRLLDLMRLVELDGAMLSRMPDQLSGGQQQRVALARALARRPRLMLLDEPFSALDTALRSATRKAVGRLLAEAGITTILVTHDQEEALSFADTVAIMREGRLAQVGSPQEVYGAPADPETARLLGEAIVLGAEIGGGSAACVLGRIPVRGTPPEGPAHIVLRPEQIRLAPVPPVGAAPPDPAIRIARVEEVEFGGPSSLLTIRLLNGPGDLYRVPAPSLECPAAGTLVALSLAGTAHVFAASPDRAAGSRVDARRLTA